MKTRAFAPRIALRPGMERLCIDGESARLVSDPFHTDPVRLVNPVKINQAVFSFMPATRLGALLHDADQLGGGERGVGVARFLAGALDDACDVPF